MITCPPVVSRKGRCTLGGPDASLLTTPLTELHRQSGAKMVPFGGWDMPVEYSGLIAEHMAVRKAAGLFDVSHMGLFEVRGEGALRFLQRTTCNDVSKLGDGQAQYSALPMESGCPVDDIIVSRWSAERYAIVVNAANRRKDWDWLVAHEPEGCEPSDRSDGSALIALQGPKSEAILSRLTDIDLPALRYYHFAQGIVDGHEAVVSRTGYTGEDGFELRVDAAAAAPLWLRLLEVGRPEGCVACGLGARDTLRLEAKMCLYGNDIDETTTLVEAGLGWIVSLEERKGNYPGRDVLATQKASGPARRLVGFELMGRGIARHGHEVVLDGERVGPVTSGTFSPLLQKSIGLCYLPAANSAVGTDFQIDVRGRLVPARVVPTPFYKRAR